MRKPKEAWIIEIERYKAEIIQRVSELDRDIEAVSALQKKYQPPEPKRP